MSAPKQDPGYESQKQIHQALGHSLRIELLFDLLEHGPTSASRFAKKHGLGKEGLSRASYHLKVLAKNDLVVLKERIPRRGAVENVYKVKNDSPALNAFLASPNGNAILASQVHGDGLIEIVHLDLDDRGVEEVEEAVREFRARLDKADATSRHRLASSTASLRSLQVVYTDVDPKSAG